MGKSLKPRNQKNKIDSNKIKQHNQCEQYISFSFLHLIPNKDYNFNFFKKDNYNENVAKSSLYERLEEISRETWEEFGKKDKKKGYESIPYHQINLNLDYLSGHVTPDCKLISIRFNKGNYRILGFRKGACPILFVIGYDFDYSAYNHG